MGTAHISDTGHGDLLPLDSNRLRLIVRNDI